tara:strand:+ start:2704 stop:3249 length:546 start_codon:yes stop_codon:yes gene_type:complete
MEESKFKEILLKMSFCVMACDGDIDPEEIKLIRELDSKENLFKLEDLDNRLNSMLANINELGLKYLKEFISELGECTLSNEQELKVVEIAIKMIEADNIVLYSEIKFFKLIHSQLALSDDDILSNFSHVNDIEYYVEQDIKTANYLDKISSDYFNNQLLPTFQSISEIENLIAKKSNTDDD